MAIAPGADPLASEGPLPWLSAYGTVPPRLEYPGGALADVVLAAAALRPAARALTYFGARTSYRGLAEAIERCAAALAALGLRAGDRITIALPTCPQGVIAFYAANRLGAVAVMVHPLCPAPEIAEYIRASRSRIALTLDLCYPKFAAELAAHRLDALVLTRIADPLGPLARLAYRWTRGRRAPRVPAEPRLHWWRPLLAALRPSVAPAAAGPDALAAIFFSGGTTGSPKGVMLSNRNLIAEGMQAAAWVALGEGDRMLAALPIFHGVGLGLCVNAVLLSGGTAILVPTFTADSVAQAIRKWRPTLMVGVPTMYDALARGDALAGADLRPLRAAFSGADALPRPIKERFEEAVARQGGAVTLVEGYGLTEAVTAIMAMPLGEYRERSVGVPFPDMRAAIFRPGTAEELPAGAEGEICVAGPAVMLGYLDDPAATAEAIRRHPDGRLWLHTGDVGSRDRDGFFYFTVRRKRMIKSSGFNVYPGQVEEVLYRHPAVAEACVIGVPDAIQGERVVACVVPRAGSAGNAELERELIAFCRERLIKWSCPRAVRFLPALPQTRLAKVDYRALAKDVGNGD
ncbi:MAG TPA: AMP-binding protein [Gemmatimonadales bacterium]